MQQWNGCIQSKAVVHSVLPQSVLQRQLGVAAQVVAFLPLRVAADYVERLLLVLVDAEPLKPLPLSHRHLPLPRTPSPHRLLRYAVRKRVTLLDCGQFQVWRWSLGVLVGLGDWRVAGLLMLLGWWGISGL